MRNALKTPFLAALLTTVVAISEARAEDAALPATIIASTSTGYWQDDAPAVAVDAPPMAVTKEPAAPASAVPARHGYYKLYAARQPDRTSKVYLQQIAATEDGPKILSTTELPEITTLKAIVTDIRPENSGGIIREPGLFATVYLKMDADAEAEEWNVMLDELGEVSVERAAN